MVTVTAQTAVALATAVALVGANAFFVAVEFALVAARAVRLETAADDGDRRSKQALVAVRDLQPRLAGAQLGITMASLGLGFVAEPAVADLVEPLIKRIADIPPGVAHSISFAVALTLVVAVHVVAGEMVPKNIAIAAPEWTARRLAAVLQVYVIVFRPVIWALNGVSNAIVRLLGMKPVDEIDIALTVKEFHTMLAGALHEGVIEPSEHELLAGALEFRDCSAGSLMVPAAEMVSVPRSTTVAGIEEVVASSGHTRVPVWGMAPDDILGFVHAKDLLHMPPDARSDPVPLELIRRMLVVSPDISAREVMQLMRRLRVHIALVERKLRSDQPGADHRAGIGQSRITLGIVTLEDVLEAIVGEIYDESDDE